MRRVLRLRAVVPLGLFLATLVVVWYLVLDEAVRRGIESVGTAVVGAKVDLAEADVRLRDGQIVLRGLQVTDPDAPMTNLVQVDEMVAAVRLAPLLQKKIFIDTAAVRGVEFGTPRATSGALPESTRERDGSGRLDAWASRVPVPDFSLDGLAGTVDVDAIRPESLATRQLAQRIESAADASRREWTARLQTLNPQPVVDSARALVDGLSNISFRSLGAIRRLAESVRSAESTLRQVTEMRDGIEALRTRVAIGTDSLRGQLGRLDEARQRDLAAARSLLQIPTLDVPDISPSLFGELAIARLRPVLRWVQQAERFVPPGLDPRRRPGPTRTRLDGTTVSFPRERGYAGLTVAFAEVDLRLAGDGAGSGRYRVLVRDLSSAPSVHGRPLRLDASRTESTEGPDAVRLHAVLNHVNRPVRDSVILEIDGLALPTLTVPGLGTRLDLGRGLNALALVREGDSVRGTLELRAPQASWDRGTLGTGRVGDIVWRTLSGLQRVELEVGFVGAVDDPRLTVRSNVGSELPRRLRDELRAEVQAAERRVRAEVERLIAEPVAGALARVAALESDLLPAVADQLQQVETVRVDLEARIADLKRRLPGGE